MDFCVPSMAMHCNEDLINLLTPPMPVLQEMCCCSQATTNFVPDSNGQLNLRTVESAISKSSRYRGVYWDNNKQLWRAGIGHQGKQHFLGYFKEQNDAAVAYDAAATMFGGPHVLNFPEKVGCILATPSMQMS